MKVGNYNIYSLILLIQIGGTDLSPYTASMGFVLVVTDLYHIINEKWRLKIVSPEILQGYSLTIVNAYPQLHTHSPWIMEKIRAKKLPVLVIAHVVNTRSRLCWNPLFLILISLLYPSR